MKNLILWAALAVLCGPSIASAGALYDREGIELWLKSDIPRGRGYPVRNALPQGTLIKFCAGAGCKIKASYAFSEAQLKAVAAVMESARRNSNCTTDSPACERLALQYGVRAMDRIVRDQKLARMSLDDVVRESINKDNLNDPENFAERLSPGQQLLRDCVDQAVNGSSYLIVLGERGLVRHHRVIVPGMINLGLQPHFFTRVQELRSGAVYRFDLYRTPRTDFDKLPGIERQ